MSHGFISVRQGGGPTTCFAACVNCVNWCSDQSLTDLERSDANGHWLWHIFVVSIVIYVLESEQWILYLTQVPPVNIAC